MLDILSSNDDIAKILAERIKRERIAQGHKQIDLAKKANVKPHVVRNLEQHHKITMDNLISLLRALRKLSVFDEMFDFEKERIEVDAFEYREKHLRKQKKRVYSEK